MRVLAALSALAALLPTVSALAFPNRGVPLPIGTECAPVVVCESGCCSSYMNLNPNKTVCADAGVCAARGLGDWQFWWVAWAVGVLLVRGSEIISQQRDTGE